MDLAFAGIIPFKGVQRFLLLKWFCDHKFKLRPNYTNIYYREKYITNIWKTTLHYMQKYVKYYVAN